MSNGKVVILGITGHVGRALAEAFVAKGWDVTGMVRSKRQPIPGVHLVEGDADSVADMKRAIGDTSVVVNALNLPYHQWDKGRAEAQIARVIEAMGTSGKTLLFPGNIYNFNAADRVVTPDLPQRPQTPRGAIRVRLEAQLEAAAAQGGLQVIILRAGDFYGPHARMDWFDQAILREAAKGKVATIGKSGVGHAWAYLPDLADAFESLAAVRSSLGAFERFHFAGHFVTPEELGAAIAKVAPVPVSVSRFPFRLIMGVMGLFNPIMREAGRMAYLWENPMELRDDRLDEILGQEFGTPFEAAIEATILPFFAASVPSERSLELTAPQRV